MGYFQQINKSKNIKKPKTGEKFHPWKETIHFKMSKDLFNKLNDEKNKIFIACDSTNIPRIKDNKKSKLLN